MVTTEPPPQTSPEPKGPASDLTWLIPGEMAWEVWEQSADGSCRLSRALAADESGPLSGIDVTALPSTLVTCQLFWLETTDEKAVGDLVRMQCERRALRRQEEVWSHRILRKEGERSLAQVLILQNQLPPQVLSAEDSRFEILARCRDLPAHSVCVWRSLGAVNLAITDEKDVLHFQSLPHRALTAECLGDIKAALWLSAAQSWTDKIFRLVLVGDWNTSSTSEIQNVVGLKVERMPESGLALPSVPGELVPREVRRGRIVRRRRRRFFLVGLALAALYAVFLLNQIVSGTLHSMSQNRLQHQLDAIMPSVLEMQQTARRLDALNPAIDTRTYPLELLMQVTALLPEKGVRLTRFEITGNRIEIGGESSTAREAFDYMQNLEEAQGLRHVDWDAPAQPIPLPNDTTRFTIQGTIQGAFTDADQT